MRTMTAQDELMIAAEADRFRYGHREVRRRQPDGSYQLVLLPLTLWDLLHPQENDKPMHGLRHAKECYYLFSVIGHRVAPTKGALVLQDTGVYWDVPGIPHHSPDVSVIFDVDRQSDDWPSFYVSREGVRPTLLFEVVSPGSRNNDVVTKLAEYHQAEVPWYVLVDRKKVDDWPTIRGYRYFSDRYEPIPLDEHGCLLIEPLGLKLGTIQNRIVLYDATTGEELGDYTAISEALEAAEKQAREATAAREAAEKQARLAQEKTLAAEQEARAAQEKALAAEAARADLERQIRELRAQLPTQPDVPPAPAT